jgi:alcohol dehydrogenase class IV
LHETAYNNNVTKIKHATKKLAELKSKILKYDADLKLSRAEAEFAKLAHSFNFDVTTDFGQIEDVIQDKIGLNRAKVRVAADLSGQGLEEIQREQAVEKAMADQALREFEVEMGMVTPETAGVKADDKELGSERTRQTAS